MSDSDSGRARSDIWRVIRYEDKVREAAYIADAIAEYLRTAAGREYQVRWESDAINANGMQTDAATSLTLQIVKLNRGLMNGQHAPFPGAFVDRLLGLAAHESGHVIIDKAIGVSDPQRRARTIGARRAMISNLVEDMLIDGASMRRANRGMGELTKSLRIAMRPEHEDKIAKLWRMPGRMPAINLVNVWGCAVLFRCENVIAPGQPGRDAEDKVIARLLPISDALINGCRTAIDASTIGTVISNNIAAITSILTEYEQENEDEIREGEEERQRQRQPQPAPAPAPAPADEDEEDEEDTDEGDASDSESDSGDADSGSDADADADADEDSEDGDSGSGDASEDEEDEADEEDEDGDASGESDTDADATDGDGESDAPFKSDSDSDSDSDASGESEDASGESEGDSDSDSEDEDEDESDSASGDAGDGAGSGDEAGDEAPEWTDEAIDPCVHMSDADESDESDAFWRDVDRESNRIAAENAARRGDTDAFRALAHWTDKRTAETIRRTYERLASEPMRQRRLDSGRIDRRRLAYMDSRDDLFRRQTARRIDGTLSILLDMSASTRHSQELIKRAGASVYAALKRTEVQPYVYAFTDGGLHLDRNPVPGGVLAVANPDRVIDFARVTGDGGTNTDEAIAAARNAIGKARGELNVIVIVTDGMPNNLLRTLAEMEASRRVGFKVVTLFVGTHSDEMTAAADASAYVRDYQRLAPALAAVVDGLIKGTGKRR